MTIFAAFVGVIIQCPPSLAADEFSSAISLYQSVPPRADSQFRESVEELMKIFYKEARWQEFFAYAVTYREFFAPKDRGEVELLETLALMRHCQSEALAQNISELRRVKPGYRDHLDRIEALSRSQFAGKSSATDQTPATSFSSHFSGQFERRIHGDLHQIHNFNPQRLKIRVKNLC